MFKRIIILLPLLIFVACSGEKTEPQGNKVEFESDYRTYARVLESNLAGDLVNYHGLQKNRADLDNFIDQLAGLTPDDLKKMTRDEQMALWINAYNGLTLRSVIDAYPVESIRDIDGVWKEKRWPVAGREVTLDQIEHKILRPEFRDPRVHFAVNCASIGCPPLYNKPFSGDSLEQQLETVTYNLINNPTRNVIDQEEKIVVTSEIFSWFASDFVEKYSTEKYPGFSFEQSAVFNFILTYSADNMAASVANSGDWLITYLEYDWQLNDTDSE